MSRLIEINQLTLGPTGVYSHPRSAEKDFAYSDGSETEQYLHKVLSEANDLGSYSEELQQHIKDWPSEYHLSSKRANLLRPFELTEGARVLELGCGCGAITRYLGEQGLEVDAVEGSEVRANLARLRCRDLDTVNLIQANFNRVELPEDNYDYVLLIGVSEYARRFSPDSDSDRGAVVDLLNRIRQSLKPDGKVIIAIENRTGLKYLHGAHEDHYSLRFVGIDNYDDSAGIRTYTRNEWRHIAAETGFDDHAFAYPFPDYKIPTVMLGETFVGQDENAWCHLEGIHSDDYTFLFDPYIPESLSWQAYNAAGVMGDMANSFLLVLSKSGGLDNFTRLAFAHLPDFRRRRNLCTVIWKNNSEGIVHRRSFIEQGAAAESTEPYHGGQLLSSRWARCLLIYSNAKRFIELVREYHEFLRVSNTNGALPTDLLPNNIIVDDAGRYLVFDQEWDGENNSVAYLLFRALLTFANHYRPAMRQFCRRLDINTVDGFIRFCFRNLGLDHQDFHQFCDLEDAFQNRVLVARNADTRAVLDTPLMENPVNAMIEPRLFWRSGDADFNDACSMGERITPEPDGNLLEFWLPDDVTQPAQIRFDPCDQHRPWDTGLITINSILISKSSTDGGEVTLLKLQDPGEIIDSCRLKGMQSAGNSVLAICSDDPAIFVDIPSSTPANGRIRIRIRISYQRNPEYQAIRQAFLERESGHLNQIESLQHRLGFAKKAEHDLRRIQASRLWRILSGIKKRFR